MRCRKCGADLSRTRGECPECGVSLPAFRSFPEYVARIEEVLLATALCAMVLLVLVQILLRNVFSVGIMGGAEIVRHLVLWVAFLGAGIAARDGKHIKIEIAQRVLPARWRRIFEVVTGVFSVIVCGILVYASVNFVSVDYRSGSVIAFFKTPVWILQTIIPVGYMAVALRFAGRCAASARALVKGE